MLGKKKKEDDIIEIEGEYLRALKKKYVPILTLDGRWHQLFPDSLKTKKLKKLEKDLNRLIKKQGKTNTDIKEYEKAKKILMKNVLNNMTDGQELDSPIRSKKQDANQKLLEELQEKLKEAEILQEQLPLEIKEANHELLLESMRICYENLITNTQKIEEEELWINTVRATLTEHILHKQEMEQQNEETYRYMHDLLGADIVEIFDRENKVWKGEKK